MSLSAHAAREGSRWHRIWIARSTDEYIATSCGARLKWTSHIAPDDRLTCEECARLEQSTREDDDRDDGRAAQTSAAAP